MSEIYNPKSDQTNSWITPCIERLEHKVQALNEENNKMRERKIQYEELVYDRRLLWDALFRILNHFPQITDARIARNIARQALESVRYSGVKPTETTVSGDDITISQKPV